MGEKSIDGTLHAQIAAEIEKTLAARNISQNALARELALGKSGQALISKLLRGERVSDATLRRIGRALGCIAPPRRMIRRVLTPEEAAAWDALPRAERLRRLTQ